MLRAIIFDFNGVLVNDEPLHLELLQRVLRDEGLSVETEEYYAHYLGLDDRGCFREVYRRHGRTLSDTLLHELIRRKARYYRESIENRLIPFPGVDTLIPTLSSRLPLAVASGALRAEIEWVLAKMSLRRCFQVIVSAEDVSEGKPSPEIFIRALSLLNQKGTGKPIEPRECLVIEDSMEGILAAHRAGMKCLAITNSHPAVRLKEAEATINGLDEVDLRFLEGLFSPETPQ